MLRQWGLIGFTLVGLWVFDGLHMAVILGFIWLIITPQSRLDAPSLLILTVGFTSLGKPAWIILSTGIFLASWVWLPTLPDRKKAISATVLVLILSLGFYKSSYTDIEWIGFSYLTLRLIMVGLESLQNRLPTMTLPQLLIYTCFPLTFLAGPIDRPERFLKDLESPSPNWIYGAERLAWGLLKKFILADSLALIALSPQLSADVKNSVGAWIITYAYAWQLFWDFSGYTDIVIGLGLWLGFELPENFNQPYFKSNLALFWQNWHITLTNWFRVYVFLPFTRGILRRKISLPNYLLAQILTMSLIAAWHGLTLNFLIWGLWHAVGLWVQRLWRWELPKPVNIFLTFHYVVLGWVWFALPDPQMSLDHFGKLFGL